MYKLIHVSENVWFRVAKKHFFYLFLKGSFNKSIVFGNNSFVPVEHLSVLAIQLFGANLAEFLSAAVAVTCAWAVGNFLVKG